MSKIFLEKNCAPVNERGVPHPKAMMNGDQDRTLGEENKCKRERSSSLASSVTGGDGYRSRVPLSLLNLMQRLVR
jgi:hypothetical protein